MMLTLQSGEDEFAQLWERYWEIENSEGWKFKKKYNGKKMEKTNTSCLCDCQGCLIKHIENVAL